MNDEQKALAAIQLLLDLGLSAARVKWLMSQPERTEEMVREQLDRTDAAIQQAREDD